MSAFNFRQALGLEKPHSSTTDWIDILTGTAIEEEAYDGIPELVETINLQASGPAEASRALRKKLKHGNAHQQYRALVLLKALVENCGTKFQTTFADGQLADALKHMAGDFGADKKVRKKLLLVLASWKEQFKGEPSMSLVAGLYDTCRRASRGPSRQELAQLTGLTLEDNRKAEKEEAKRKAGQEKEGAKERARKEEEERRRRANHQRRAPFDFEKEKPKVLTSIVDASQASSNLVNAIRLVNPENDSLETNTRVQECLEKAKQCRKIVVRYIQLVENEELIGTLIETNERVMSAIETYSHILAHGHGESTDEIAKKLSETQISVPSGDALRSANNSQQATRSPANAGVYSDLQDLNFGSIEGASNNLPPPIRPSSASRSQEQASYDNRGSLSDFSDYESSNEETPNTSTAKYQGTGRRDLVTVSDDEGVDLLNNKGPQAPLTQAEDKDPFADPFADGSSKRW